MSRIEKQDTQGTKPLLNTGELGYDNYPTGGDVGRVYVGTGTENVAIAKKSEVVVLDNKTNAHIARVDNPHNVTKAQVGLGNADNTADVNKSVLSATKLTTPRSITISGEVAGSVSFDGSTDVNISTTIQPNSVALGTDTTGNYVSSVIAGSGVTVTGVVGEGWTPSIAIAPVGTSGTYTKVTTNDKGQVVSGDTLTANDIPNLDASKITSGIIDAARLPTYVDDVLEYDSLSAFPTVGETGKIYVALDTNKTYRWSGSTYVYITSGAVDSVAGKTGVVTLVKADVGLTNVDNTSDINKPISTATQTALNNKVDKVSGKGLSTEDYTTAEKTKLSGLSNYALPVASTTTLGGVKAGANVTIDVNGVLNASGDVTSVAGKTGSVTLTKSDVGLANVDNTSDANKPISTATQNALSLKANAADAVLTGTPTAPTAAVGTNTTQLATTAYVNAEIANDAPSKTGTGASGTWEINVSGNSATATKLSTTRANYKATTDSVVVGELMWKQFGNNHTIYDASASTTPTGVAKNNTNPDVAWQATYPTLMGYNGTSTYGVRVDSSRYADQLKTAKTIGGVSFDGSANIDLPGVNKAGNQNTSGSSGSLSIIDRLNSEDANNLTTNSINTWGSNGINIPFSASKILHIGNNSWPTQLGFDAYNNMLSLRTRASNNGTWRAWSKIYTEADPQINITGNAATATNATKLNNAAEDANATANTIVKRDASGYIKGVYFHTTAADTTTASSHYYVETGSDGYVRPKPLANVRDEVCFGNLYKNSATFTASGTWTAPAGVTRVMLVGAGGGGGGEGAIAAPSYYVWQGGSGGGGSGAIVHSVTVVPGTAYTVTIGAGGAAGAARTDATIASTGGNGGTSVFGTINFYGGKGGSSAIWNTGRGSGIGGGGGYLPYSTGLGHGNTASYLTNGFAGCPSGQYTGGTALYSEPTSGSGVGSSTNAGCGGGAGIFGNGGNAVNYAAGGAGGANTGAGGAGGMLTAASVPTAGGAGGSGKIIVYW